MLKDLLHPLHLKWTPQRWNMCRSSNWREAKQLKISSCKRMNRCELQNSLKQVLCPSTNSSKHYVRNIQQNQDETKHMPLPTPTILELWSSCHPPTCPCQWVFFWPYVFPMQGFNGMLHPFFVLHTAMWPAYRYAPPIATSSPFH